MGIGIEGQNLIFLISQPRAGSTMTQRILASHPDIHTVSEPWLMLHPLYAMRSQGYEAEYNAALARTALKGFFEEVSSDEDAYFVGVRKMCGHFYNCALNSSNKSYFLDKTPRYYHIIPELHKTFPQASFIILFRNPLSVACSIFSTWGKEEWFNLDLYKEDLTFAPAKLIDGIKQLGKNCLTLSYEDLLVNSESEIRRVCNFLGVQFSVKMLEYGACNLPRWQYGDQDLVYQKVRPDPGNLDKWILSVKSPHIWQVTNEYLEYLGHDTLSQMGYSYRELRKTLDANRPQEIDVTKISQVEWLQRKPDQYQEVPKTSLGYTVIAKKNERDGKLVESATAYRKAIKLNSKSAWSYHSLGTVLAKLQRWDEVIASYQKAIKLNPNSASFYYDLAQAFIQQGNLDEAIANYSKAIEIKPSFSMGYNRLGEAFAKKGKLAEAASFFLKAVELNSGSYKARGNLAEVLAEEGHLNEAVGFYAEAVKINPSYRTENLKLQEAVEFFCNHHDDKSVSKASLDHAKNLVIAKASDSAVTNKIHPNLNLALNKPTTQSSVFEPEIYGYDPQGACNGKKTGGFGFHTLPENQPWWQIDLQGIYQISEIKIYNRINFEKCASTLNILLSQDALNWELCYSNDQENIFGGIDGKPLIVDVQDKVARFVQLKLRESTSFHLDEVEIYGIPFKLDDSQFL